MIFFFFLHDTSFRNCLVPQLSVVCVSVCVSVFVFVFGCVCGVGGGERGYVCEIHPFLVK